MITSKYQKILASRTFNQGVKKFSFDNKYHNDLLGNLYEFKSIQIYAHAVDGFLGDKSEPYIVVRFQKNVSAYFGEIRKKHLRDKKIQNQNAKHEVGA